MRSYLSKIAFRAVGTTQKATIKPNKQSRFIKKNKENRLNPFDEEGDFTEASRPTTTIESSTSPLRQTLPHTLSFKDRQHLQNDHEREKSDILRSDRKISVKQEEPVSNSPEINITPTSSKIRAKAFKTEKSPDKKPLEVKKQVIEKGEKIIKEIHTSEKLESVKQVSINPASRNRKTSLSKEKTSKKKKKIQVPDQSSGELIQPTILLKNEVKPATSESKNIIKPHKINDRTIPEIRPKPLLKKHPLLLSEKKQKEKHLIIGNLKVEVVTSQPVRASREPVKKIQRIVKTIPRQESSPGSNKLRFGLGQM